MKTMACFLPLGLAAFVLSAHADVEITTDHSDAMYRCVEKAVFTVKVMAENGALMSTGKVSAVVDNFGPCCRGKVPGTNDRVQVVRLTGRGVARGCD